MRNQYALSLAMMAGVGVGAVAVQAIHAQTKPPVYNIVEVDVKDPAGFAKEYLPVVQATIKADGGRYVAAGGAAGGGKVTAIEGTAPASRVSILAWDSLEQFQAHHNSSAYKAARQIGDKYATFRSFTVDGVAN